MSDLIPFEFEANNVRIIMDENNQPMFVAKDVAKALGYKDLKTSIRSHCRGVRRMHPLSTNGGTQNVRVIYEPDVYRLIIGSRLPSAQRFEKWVFEEVLPSIRKTGQYRLQEKPVVKTLHDPMLQAVSVMLAELDAVKHEQAQIKATQQQSELNSLKRDRKLVRDQAKLTHRLDALETAIEYFTIIGWWSLTYGESLPTETAATYGRIAAKYCRKHGYEIGKTTDSRYGRVNTYPKEVLDELFLD